MKMRELFSGSSVGQRRFSRCLRSHVWLLSLLTLVLNISPAQAQNAVVLVGTGSSVPAPLYTRWTQEYGKRNPNIQMRYLPVGTSEGIKETTRGRAILEQAKLSLPRRSVKTAA